MWEEWVCEEVRAQLLASFKEAYLWTASSFMLHVNVDLLSEQRMHGLQQSTSWWKLSKHYLGHWETKMVTIHNLLKGFLIRWLPCLQPNLFTAILSTGRQDFQRSQKTIGMITNISSGNWHQPTTPSNWEVDMMKLHRHDSRMYIFFFFFSSLSFKREFPDDGVSTCVPKGLFFKKKKKNMIK